MDMILGFFILIQCSVTQSRRILSNIKQYIALYQAVLLFTE